MTYNAMFPSDGKMPFLKTTTRWEYNKGWVVRWRKYHIYRAKAAVAVVAGIYFFQTIPLISLGAFCFAAFCYKWSQQWSSMIKGTDRTVMTAR